MTRNCNGDIQYVGELTKCSWTPVEESPGRFCLYGSGPGKSRVFPRKARSLTSSSGIMGLSSIAEWGGRGRGGVGVGGGEW